MRGLAAALVLMRHLWPFFGQLKFPASYLAVDLFFVLSGFVMSHAYSERLDAGMSVRTFLKARIIRLAPFYYLGLALGTLAPLCGAPPDGQPLPSSELATDFVHGLFLLPVLQTPGTRLYPLNQPCWSLLFEVVANLLMALFWRRLSNRVLLAVCAVSAAALMIVACRFGTIDFGWKAEHWWVGFARVGYSFPLGVLLHRQRERLAFSANPYVALALVGAVLMAPMEGQQQAIYGIACIVAVLPTLVLLGRRDPIRGQRLFLAAGAVSYGLYAIHSPTGALLKLALFKGLNVDVSRFTPLSGFLALPAIAGLVSILDTRFDRPARRWLSGTFGATRRGYSGRRATS